MGLHLKEYLARRHMLATWYRRHVHGGRQALYVVLQSDKKLPDVEPKCMQHIHIIGRCLHISYDWGIKTDGPRNQHVKMLTCNYHISHKGSLTEMLLSSYPCRHTILGTTITDKRQQV